MIFSKKRGEFDPMKVLGGALLVLLIAIVLISILGKYFPGLLSLRNCDDRGGVCTSKAAGCPKTHYQEIGIGGCRENEICCMPYEKKPGSLSEFTDKERDAIYNAFVLKLNNDPTPIEDRARVDLKVDTNYTFHLTLNDELKSAKDKIGDCAVYVKDEREEGKRYYFKGDGSLEIGEGDLLLNQEIFDCKPGKEISKEFSFKPSLLDVYKDLMLYVILFDKDTVATHDEEGNQIADVDRQAMYSNMDHWVAYRAYRLNIEPVISIKGLSGAWVAEDQITLSCDDVTCTRFGVKLVKLSNDKNYDQMIKECEQDKNFAYALSYIAGSQLKTSGIPLNIDIGGYRLPVQKQKILYLTEKRPIAVVENKAEITIDKATMVSTFYNETNHPSSYFVGDSTYLCVQAQTRDRGKAYGLSKTPLRVDILPPFIDQETGIHVIYPDPVESINKETPYYYRQHPRVAISQCYDYGQSGCSNYDYYIHTGDFVNLRAVTADWETGVKALLLTEGLNMLFNFLATKDPLNTICPYMHSNYYRVNSNSEIRVPYMGQGIMCIRAGDKVGNTELYWTEVWTPDEMFKRIIAEDVAELVPGMT